MRDPFEFARSCADWNRVPLTSEYLRGRLEQWVDYLLVNRRRSTTGRYAFLKYESLVHDPEAALGPVLTGLGLDWDETCLAPLSQRHGPSLRKSPLPSDAARIAAAVPKLETLTAELRYALPPGMPSRRSASAECSAGSATQLNRQSWQLNPPFTPDGTCGWGVPMDLVPDLAKLAHVADDLQNPRRSPLRLFEDDEALGPPHSLHVIVRERGCGRYSHWAVGHVLLFSTSDNSDPNCNGRTYRIAIGRSP